jgi:hypothetical protein
MKDQMVEMLVNKRMQAINTDQLIAEKREDLINEICRKSVINLFREDFPEYCAPEMSEPINNLIALRETIICARHHKGRMPQNDFECWADMLSEAIVLLRQSAIKLPND